MSYTYDAGLRANGRNPDALDPRRMEQLGKKTDDFRTRQRREFEEKELERKGGKARAMLVKFDEEVGVKVSLVGCTLVATGHWLEARGSTWWMAYFLTLGPCIRRPVGGGSGPSVQNC